MNNLDILHLDGVYSSDVRSFPPAEKFDHVASFEITQGCRHNGCTYCDLYDGKRFRELSLKEYRRHVLDVFSRMEQGFGERTVKGLERIFIGSGNALSVDTEKLVQAMKFAVKVYRKKTGKAYPRRIAMFGHTQDILNKSKDDLKSLSCIGICGEDCPRGEFGGKVGLNLVYWGIESGSNDVLRYVNKNHTFDEVVEASRRLYNADFAGIKTSVMIMPGLGGKKFEKSHTEETIKLLREMPKPEFITFMGVNPAPNTVYARRMQEEIRNGTNRPLTNKELRKQVIAIIEGLRYGTKVGCFDCDIDGVGHNPMPFGSFDLSGFRASEDLLRSLRFRNFWRSLLFQ